MIEIEHLKKNYGNHIVINDFNLEIKDNEMIALIGASGSGKSTLLNIIGLIDQEYDGNIIIDNTNIKKLNKKSREKFIRYNINYLFQNYALIDTFDVEENLLIGLEYEKMNKKEKKDKIIKVLKELKLDNYLHKKIFELSGGEQQRVALARIMLKPGKIVLADEPTGNLDTENSEIVISILKKLKKKNKTIIVVTHSEYVAQQCDRIISI